MIAETYPQTLLSLCVFREARGEKYQAKLGVAWVIRNRVNDWKKRWPRDTVGVILQHSQFTAFSKGDPNLRVYPAPTDVSWLDCCRAVESNDADPTDGANNYHSLTESQKPWPQWADPLRMTVHIGAFRFYRL